MKVGILGSGDVAKALARGFIARSDEVMLGSREPAKLDGFIRESSGRAKAGTFEQAARFGEAIVLATLGTATEAALETAGIANFAGKLVIDTTNPLSFEHGPDLAWGFTDSNGERVQRKLISSHVVKAFNTTGNALFVQPKLPGGPPTMFIAGDDSAAKGRVADILRDFGWESADIGGIKSARYLEAMCLAWVMYGFTNNSWAGHAFKLLRKA